MAKLSQAAKFLALEFQNAQYIREAAVLHGNVRKQLDSAVSDLHKDGYGYGYYVDHSGDGSSGDVVYQSNGKLKKAGYAIGKGEDGKMSVSVAHDKAKNVTAVMSYKESEALSVTSLGSQESDHKKQRNPGNALPNGDQGAGNPAADQAQGAWGRASSEASSRVIRETQGQNNTWKPDGVLLQESARFMEQPRLTEAITASYPIKLISPGRGSSGWYGPDVLKKASEAKVFKAGTQMFWNHDTDTQESERPEGDLDRLAAVTTTDAKYDEAGHDGPGLYARAKVFSDYADKVKEKGPHIGLSIRAGGSKDEAAVGPDGRKGVITALRNAASVDFVTKAGRDGKIFTESAVEEGEEMDEATLTKLVEAAVTKAVAPLQADNKRLSEALAVQAAPTMVKKFLEGVRLPDATKTQIAEKFASPAVTAMIPMKEGKIDEPEFTKMIEAEAVRQRDYLMALGWNTDAASQGLRMSEAEIAADDTKTGKNFEEAISNVVDIFVGAKREGDPLRESARTAFAKGRVA